ncbi:carboxy terminal-processing peptidase [Flavobacterium hibisci]|uniref:carboxy terminal-processing peptidase n=1 Tax=Flavobacterium hibisci TaxID=1914462 RepID=UPI00042312B2|nr:carboxy terminal-processing peptidase [Flavobacterium hibisci]MBZ4041585.1 carboxy terminal-processing peptidase [Flavobacterium hibisci]
MNAIIKFMKRNYKILIAVLCLSVTLFAFKVNADKTVDPDPNKDKMLLEILAFVIEKGHYNPPPIDDEFSKGIFKDYIDALDPSKRFFLQSDIDEFRQYELMLDDQFINKDLTFFNLTYARLMKRMEESKKRYKTILAQPFNYNIDETFNADYEKIPYAKSTAEINERWRMQIKLSTLSSLVTKQKLEEDKKKTDPSYKVKSFEALEKETRESSLKSLDDNFSLIKDLDKQDWFSVYVNSIMTRFDPHTSYFAPEEKDRFDVNISGKLEGIGARLTKKNDFTQIDELISGGPAWKGKELESGDLILKVGQGKEEPVDVVGMRLDDVVKKIKGHKGTEVRLTVKKVDGSIKVISIIRDVVEIEETYAKSSIVEKNGLKYGVIYLPKFYIDFENKDGRDAGKDIALEVERLKKENISGIVLDVRDDGGGSLSTVVDIAGLFIEEGPIVQVKSAGKKKEVLYDKDKKIEWDGPLVIMVNSFSASASEILAAAIQDYKRGVIIGSKQTYGKGTVQTVIDLNQFVRNSDFGDFGALKATAQKFYRINGGSTQLEGVKSDVVMPDRYAYLKMGERDMDNAMPWDKIDPANYNVWNSNENFNQAISNSKIRIAQNPQFKLIEDNAKWIDVKNKENTYSLNIKNFKATQEQVESEGKKYKPIADYKNNLVFKSLPYENLEIAKDASLKEKREAWHKALSKDIYVEEALNVLDDLQPKGNVNKQTNSSKIKKDKVVKS